MCFYSSLCNHLLNAHVTLCIAVYYAVYVYTSGVIQCNICIPYSKEHRMRCYYPLCKHFQEFMNSEPGEIWGAHRQ